MFSLVRGKMFDRLDLGSAQNYYWLLQSVVGLREITIKHGRVVVYLIWPCVAFNV